MRLLQSAMNSLHPTKTGANPCHSCALAEQCGIAMIGSPGQCQAAQERGTRGALEVTCSFLVGMVVLRGMSVVMTPPAVSMPSDSGATSSSSRSCTFALVSPPRMAACAQVQQSQASVE